VVVALRWVCSQPDEAKLSQTKDILKAYSAFELNKRGSELTARGEYWEAMDCFKKAVEIDPDWDVPKKEYKKALGLHEMILDMSREEAERYIRKLRYPKLIVETGRVYFLSKETGEMKEGKEYVLGKERNRENPVTIGRESSETIGRKDILLAKEHIYTSLHQGEIFFDEGENAYFLIDYSLNGTLVNGDKVGGKPGSRNAKATARGSH